MFHENGSFAITLLAAGIGLLCLGLRHPPSLGPAELHLAAETDERPSHSRFRPPWDHRNPPSSGNERDRVSSRNRDGAGPSHSPRSRASTAGRSSSSPLDPPAWHRPSDSSRFEAAPGVLISAPLRSRLQLSPTQNRDLDRLQAKLEEQLQEILTPEQFAQLEALQEEHLEGQANSRRPANMASGSRR